MEEEAEEEEGLTVTKRQSARQGKRGDGIASRRATIGSFRSGGRHRRRNWLGGKEKNFLGREGGWAMITYCRSGVEKGKELGMERKGINLSPAAGFFFSIIILSHSHARSLREGGKRDVSNTFS